MVLSPRMQLVPKLDGIEELLNMPLDEDCLEKLLSRDDADDHRSSAKVGHAVQSGTCCMDTR